MLSVVCGPRFLLIFALLAGVTALHVFSQPALADILLPRPKPQPRPPRPQPPLPKPLPEPESDEDQRAVRNVMVGLSAGLTIGLLGVWIGRRYRQSHLGVRRNHAING